MVLKYFKFKVNLIFLYTYYTIDAIFEMMISLLKTKIWLLEI